MEGFFGKFLPLVRMQTRTSMEALCKRELVRLAEAGTYPRWTLMKVKK